MQVAEEKGSRLVFRKVQRLGASSLIITLPREWARKHGVRAGNMVTIVEDGDKLVIAPYSSGRPITIGFSLRHLNVCKHMGRVVFCAYLSGLDGLSFYSNRPVRPDLIERLSKASSIIGEDLVKVSLKSMYEIDVDISSPPGSAVEALIAYGRLMASSLSKLSEAIAGGQVTMQDVEDMYRELRRSAFKLLREGSKGSSYGVQQEHLNRLLMAGVGLMVLANDSFYRLGRDLLSLLGKLNAEERERLKFLVQVLEVSLVAAVSGIEPPSVKKEEEAYSKLRMLLDLEDDLNDVVGGSSPQFAYLLARILDVARIINNIEETLLCYTLFRKYSGPEEEP